MMEKTIALTTQMYMAYLFLLIFCECSPFVVNASRNRMKKFIFLKILFCMNIIYLIKSLTQRFQRLYGSHNFYVSDVLKLIQVYKR